MGGANKGGEQKKLPESTETWPDQRGNGKPCEHPAGIAGAFWSGTSRPWRRIPWPRGREREGQRCLDLKDIYTGLDGGPGRCALEGTAGLLRAGRRRECDLSGGRALPPALSRSGLGFLGLPGEVCLVHSSGMHLAG